MDGPPGIEGGEGVCWGGGGGREEKKGCLKKKIFVGGGVGPREKGGGKGVFGGGGEAWMKSNGDHIHLDLKKMLHTFLLHFNKCSVR